MNNRDIIPSINLQQLDKLSEQLFNSNARKCFTDAFGYICRNAHVQLHPYVSNALNPHLPFESVHKSAIKTLERATHSHLKEEARSLSIRHERKLFPENITTHASVIVPYGQEFNKFRAALLVETKNLTGENIISFEGQWIRYKDGAVWKILLSSHHPELKPNRIVLFSRLAFTEDCRRIEKRSSELHELPDPSFLLKKGMKQIQDIVNKNTKFIEHVDESSLLGVRLISSSENRYSFQLNTLFGDFWLVATWCEKSLRTVVKCREIQKRSASGSTFPPSPKSS